MRARRILGVLLGFILVVPLAVPARGGVSVLPNGNVALLTDYGQADFYVGALKGALLRVCPSARVVDLSHDVPPYAVRLGAWQLWDSAREFPRGTVVVAIVDPGVGTDRRPVLLETAAGIWFVGPDNGLFTVVEREMGPATWYRIDNPGWMRAGEISATFHGRDIFGPAAGRLACGATAADAGPRIDDPIRLELPEARLDRDAAGAAFLSGEVLFADHYGNLQTNIPAAWMAEAGARLGDRLRVEAGARDGTGSGVVAASMPYVLTYGDVPEGEPLVVAASTGRLEIALNLRSAAEALRASAGTPIRIYPEGTR